MKPASLLLCLLCLSSQVYAQQHLNPLKGRFYPIKKNIGFVNEMFEFNKKNKLVYTQFHCQGYNYGTGNYEITKDSLILNFDNLPPQPPDFQVVNRTNSDLDSSVFTFEIKDKIDTSPLPGVNIILKNTQAGASANSDGFARLAVKTMPDTITLSFLGFTPVEIPVEGRSPESIHYKVQLYPGLLYFYKKGDRLAYKIEFIHRKKFRLNISDRLSVTFIKIKKRQFPTLG